MGRITVRLKKALALVREKGLASGVNEALGHWAKDRFRVSSGALNDLAFVWGENRPAILRLRGERQLIIHWIIPPFALGSGGHQTMFTTIAELERRGHQNRIFLVGAGASDAKLSTDIARHYYAPLQCEVEAFSGVMPDSDALVATSWETAYRVRTIANTSRKFYFVQDLEFQFFPEGSLRELAAETYRWGFFGITAGDWIANTLGRDFNMECVPFHFWYDASLYFPQVKERAARQILFYARPRTARRGFELGLLALGLVARRFPDLEVVMVGMTATEIRLPFRATYSGVLPGAELPQLYAQATAALVLSHTNLSLVPLELMACGCPLVSNRGPNTEWMLSEENCVLADPRAEDIAAKLIHLLEDEEGRRRLSERGLSFAATTNINDEMDTIERAFRTGQR